MKPMGFFDSRTVPVSIILESTASRSSINSKFQRENPSALATEAAGIHLPSHFPFLQVEISETVVHGIARSSSNFSLSIGGFR